LATLAVSTLFDTCLLKMGNGATQGLPRFRIAGNGQYVDNVTDWALRQFEEREISPTGMRRPITKDDIFNYVYAVLHDPMYREKYAVNLKRGFPRIPLYAEFWRWAEWGKRLMALHIGYETVEPWPLVRTDVSDEKSRRAGLPPKALLRADKGAGIIFLDTEDAIGWHS
jgi:predicted helicase